ncbi:MAG: Flp pilus assembly protein CpaB [Anaerolineales bacterium]|jgi:Flp pilus assembly protein CpaB
MRRGRVFIILALIIILGLLAVFFFQRQFLAPSTSNGDIPGEVAPTPVVQMTEIIVVTQQVARGTVMNEELLGTINFPQDSIIPGMFLADQMPAVVGRQAKLDIDAGMPLTAGMLVDVNESLSATGSIAALSIPKGMVAIPIPVDRLSSVAYALRPGDHVSVIGSFMVIDVDTEFQSALPNNAAGIISTGRAAEDAPAYLTVQIIPGGEGSIVGRTELDPLLNELVYVVPAEQQRTRLVTQILMQDAMVLRFGEFSYEDLLPEDATATLTPEEEAAARENADQQQQNPDQVEPQPEVQPPDIVTLIVTPQEAVALEYLMKREVQFTLALRSSGDVDPIDTEAATFQYLLETYNIPVPAKLPYDLQPALLSTPEVSGEQTNP